MRHFVRLSLLGCVLGLLACSTAHAQATGQNTPTDQQAGQTPPTTPKTEIFTDDWFKQTKKPVDWFEWGADLRLRAIWDKNLTTTDDNPNAERFWQRYRGRVWSTFHLPIDEQYGKLDLNVAIGWEMRNYCEPDTGSNIRDTNFDEVFFETLNLKWQKAFGLPLTVTVGRQNITNLNNWLIFEGTPLDGSRTIFFDAARATLELADIKTTVDVIYIDNPDVDNRLVFANDRDRLLVEHRERGVVLYARNKSIDRVNLDGYFIAKVDRGSNWENRAGTEPFRNSDRETYTVGIRAWGNIDAEEHWAYDAQYAQQMGRDRNAGNICAGGALAQLFYHFKDPMKNVLRAAYEYRSGDDASTGHRENFDILWGRYPQWSNIYEGYMDTFDGTRPAYAANLHRVQFGWSFMPVKDHEISADYHLLFADQNTSGATGRPVAGERTLSESGCFRGQLLTAIWKTKWNDHISTHLIGEVLFPGDYYTDEKNDPAFFCRYEIVLSW